MIVFSPLKFAPSVPAKITDVVNNVS